MAPSVLPTPSSFLRKLTNLRRKATPCVPVSQGYSWLALGSCVWQTLCKYLPLGCFLHPPPVVCPITARPPKPPTPSAPSWAQCSLAWGSHTEIPPRAIPVWMPCVERIADVCSIRGSEFLRSVLIIRVSRCHPLGMYPCLPANRQVFTLVTKHNLCLIL